MELIKELLDFVLHIDTHLNNIILQYGTLTYLVLFLVIFAETGLVFTPFLPGDSLIFAAGTFAAKGSFNIHILFLILAAAAILGDTVNYWIGHYFGLKIFERDSRVLKKEYLERTHRFYEKYGGKTIIFARFVPIVRTFAPFVAGVGSMTYAKFLTFNIVGGAVWCALFVYGGYYFGNLAFVKNNFSLVIILIIFVSIIPGIVEYLRHRLNKSVQ